MRFWDTSAVSPLLAPDAFSESAAELGRGDNRMVVWWATRVECVSAIRRRERTGGLDAAAVRRSIALLDELSTRWAEVAPGVAVRRVAERALAVHPLRAADALQLAAGQTWRADIASPAEFVSFDTRLRDAAAREGFAVLPKELPTS